MGRPAKRSKKAVPPPRPGRGTKTRGRLATKGRDVRPQTARTKVEEAMEARLATLEPDTERYHALRTAIDFKRSWLELARRLADVEQSGEFKEWGYRSFDAYAQHELHIRKDTAQKLLRSYRFLSTHERPLLDDDDDDQGPAALPSFQALDVLAAARENPYLNEKDYRELRDQVFRDDPTPAQVRKIVRDRAPEPVKKQPVDPLDRMRRALVLSERLYGLLMEEERLPDNLSRAAETLVVGLRKLVEE